MLKESEGDEGIDVQQVGHGNSARSSRTCALVSRGAWRPTLRTGSPVTRSTRILTFRDLGRRGVSRTPPAFICTSSASPAWRPSRRRTEPGSTTWPLVESLVCMVRQSYLKMRQTASLALDLPFSNHQGPDLYLPHLPCFQVSPYSVRSA